MSEIPKLTALKYPSVAGTLTLMSLAEGVLVYTMSNEHELPGVRLPEQLLLAMLREPVPPIAIAPGVKLVRVFKSFVRLTCSVLVPFAAEHAAGTDTTFDKACAHPGDAAIICAEF